MKGGMKVVKKVLELVGPFYAVLQSVSDDDAILEASLVVNYAVRLLVNLSVTAEVMSYVVENGDPPGGYSSVVGQDH